MFVKSRVIAGNKEFIVYTNGPQSLLEVIIQTGSTVDAPCAGIGRCGKCRVRVQGDLEPDTVEKDLLPGGDIGAGIRLACRKRVIGNDLVITVPAGTREQVTTSYRIEQADTGIAVDLGTTSIITAFINKSDGTIMAMHSALNPQNSYGADVVSRIKAGLDKTALDRMARITVDAVASGIGALLSEIGLDPGRIKSVSIAGNTAMEHIITDTDMSGLARAPYAPAFTSGKSLPELKSQLGVNTGNIYLFPVIGGFVGGDTLASILACGMDLSGEDVALIDVGTNAEIAVGSRDRIFASSAPAGPAFEGGQIRHGMRAQDGAIEDMHIAGNDLELDVRGGTDPEGICGSGLIRIISELLNAGVVTDSGELLDASGIDGNLSLRSVVLNGEQAFALYRSYRRDIYLYQSDVRALQLAKASIAAGLDLLLKNTGIRPSRLYIAGAFGNYLAPRDLGLIGMIPADLADRTWFIGDSVISGLRRFITNDPPVDMDKLAATVRHVELADDPSFNERFMSLLALKRFALKGQ